MDDLSAVLGACGELWRRWKQKECHINLAHLPALGIFAAWLAAMQPTGAQVDEAIASVGKRGDDMALLAAIDGLRSGEPGRRR